MLTGNDVEEMWVEEQHMVIRIMYNTNRTTMGKVDLHIWQLHFFSLFKKQSCCSKPILSMQLGML